MLSLYKSVFATQSNGVQDAGLPGDAELIDFGSFTRRAYGSKRPGWTKGWSAHNNRANARFQVAIAAGQQARTKGAYWTAFRFGEWGEAGPSNRIVRLPEILVGGAVNIGFQMNVT